ncbi:MAG: DUF86 domain-containing protein [Campylobacterota bacterium]|nr:DUF86 domain-containing protein [Campylobacterota bacterium]
MQHRIKKKIVKLRSNISLLESYAPDCKERFLKDPMYEGALLHYLYLVSDGCIALAEMVIKEKNLEQPESYAEAIDVLGDNGVIPREFAYDFARIASFRNFLAHDYEKIDHLVICEQALAKLTDIKTYLHHIESTLI